MKIITYFKYIEFSSNIYSLYLNNLVILFFDNCSSHFDEGLSETLAQHIVLVITYPSHTSHIFQVVDLILFDVLKVHKKYFKKNDQIPPKIDHLYRIFQAYEQSTYSTSVRSTF